MNESSTFCSRYLKGIETQFTRDDRNDDSIKEEKVIGEYEVFIQKVRPLGASKFIARRETTLSLVHPQQCR